jgi:hypothetical protein
VILSSLPNKRLVQHRGFVFDSSYHLNSLAFWILKAKLEIKLKKQIATNKNKWGRTIIKNVYICFYAEYEFKYASKLLNELISVLLAVRSRTLIKVYLYNLYYVSFVPPVSSVTVVSLLCLRILQAFSPGGGEVDT